MKLLVVSSAPFIYKNGQAHAYGPYIAEMALWAKYCGSVSFCCPVWKDENGLLTTPVPFPIQRHYRVANFDLNSPANAIKAVFISFYNFVIVLRAMLFADHIHLRCPGNIGFLGCIAQLFFPFKTKTAKYAGNWDFNVRQPLSYLWQKKILSCFLTRNMQVLVYGQWRGQTKNIKPFFTATYSENDKTQPEKPMLSDGISIVFAGMLTEGKNPLYGIALTQQLHQKGINIRLSLYGEGAQRAVLENYIMENQLQHIVSLHGNQPAGVLKKAYQESHFVLLPSQSEGWPKAVAEGMFWGAVPIVTPVSCVPFMVGHGTRGILLDMDIDSDTAKIAALVSDQKQFESMSHAAREWSQEYTLEKFESEIKKLLS